MAYNQYFPCTLKFIGQREFIDILKKNLKAYSFLCIFLILAAINFIILRAKNVYKQMLCATV